MYLCDTACFKGVFLLGQIKDLKITLVKGLIFPKMVNVYQLLCNTFVGTKAEYILVEQPCCE